MTRWFVALALALVAAVAWGRAAAEDRGVLWTVQGRQNTVYLLGSVHVLRPGDAALPRAALDAYADAEQLVMEIDLDDATVGDPLAIARQMQASAALPAGQSLQAVLGSDYAEVERRAGEAGLDLAMFDRFQPWFVATLLLQLELAKRGFDPALGIEQQLAGRAVADRKPIMGLETPAQQFAVLSGLSLADQKRFLLMTLDESAQADAELEQLLAAWRKGDTSALAALLSDEFERFPQLYRPLTEDRNRAWVGQLDDLLDDRDDYLVVVGALHLVGRDSVVDLLRQRGHTVTQH